MAYLTADLVTARVGGADKYLELTDDDNSGQPDPNVVQYVLGDVDALLEAYARRGGYTLPLVAGDVPAVMGLLLDIANYRLKSRGGKEPTAADQSAFDAAMLFLVALADGSVQLSSIVSAQYVTDFGIDSQDQIFSRDLLRNF